MNVEEGDGPQQPPEDQQQEEEEIQDENNIDNALPVDLMNHPAIVAFQLSGASFIVTNPTLPGNPIIFASQGFLHLTQYPIDRVLGRNCRFLQGPETDPVAVSKMRESLDQGLDVSCVLLNYRCDGTTFWNHVLISGVRETTTSNNDENSLSEYVKYYIGLQCPTKAPSILALSQSNSSNKTQTFSFTIGPAGNDDDDGAAGDE